MNDSSVKEDAALGPVPPVRARCLLAPSDSGVEQTVKSFVAGGVATVFDYSVMLWFFAGLHLARTIAVAAGYSVGLVICYVASIVWIFPHRKLESRHAEFAIFVVIGLIGLGLTQVIIDLGIRVLQAAHGVLPQMSAAMELSIMKAVAIVLVFFFNFAARKYMLFSRGSAATDCR